MKYSEQQIQDIADNLPAAYEATNGNFAATAERLGLSRGQLSGIVSKYPDVQVQFKESSDKLLDRVESMLHEIALNPQDWRGINVSSAIFLLKSKRREVYGDRQTIEVQDSGYAAGAKQEREEESERPSLTVLGGGRGGTPQTDGRT